jgi:hypothetical protein
MYTINIKHKGDNESTSYIVYRAEEARKENIEFKYWKDAEAGEYALSDDNYVAKVISRREYDGNRGFSNIYMRFPWGYTFFTPKYPSKKLNVKGRKTNTTFTGKSYIEVQSGQDKMKNLASMFALKPDYDLAIEWAMGAVTDSERRKWKRTMKSEVFKTMVREERQKLLQDHELTEDYTFELMKETINLAKEKKDVSNLMRAVENLQDLHGMKDKDMVKTVDKLEVGSATRLIDELREEEQNLIATRTTIEPKEEDDEKREGS